jgi:hypothetical protein
MIRHTIIYFFFYFICGSIFSQSLVIPDGINYKFATDEVVEKAQQIIAHELSTPTYNIFNDQLYCGPTIWSRYKLLERPAQIKKGNITFKVPINGIQTNQLGKLIQSQGDFKIIWNQIIQDFSESKLTIRRIRPEELKSFWSIIFYDIEEPLLIVESNSHKIAMDFNANMQLIFLEEL